MICGEIMRGTAVEIDEGDLEAGEEWTPVGYFPKRDGDGIQRQVYP
jgi:hypothetical protein